MLDKETATITISSKSRDEAAIKAIRRKVKLYEYIEGLIEKDD